MEYIMKVVPHGVTAVGFDTSKEEGGFVNLDQPCDLVVLELNPKNGYEKELERKAFNNGHEASNLMIEVLLDSHLGITDGRYTLEI